MRPSRPVPAICRGSSVCSASSLRTTGESLSSASALSRGRTGALASTPEPLTGAAGRAALIGAAIETVEFPAADCGADSRMTASFAPTLAVTPSAINISASTPFACAGISVLTLSVSTSNRRSSALTASPTFLYHFVTVPSATVSPSCGMITSIDAPGSNQPQRHGERGEIGRQNNRMAVVVELSCPLLSLCLCGESLLSCFVNDLPADHGDHRLQVLDRVLRHSQVVAVEHQQVGVLALLDRAQVAFLEEKERVRARVRDQCLFPRDGLPVHLVPTHHLARDCQAQRVERVGGRHRGGVGAQAPVDAAVLDAAERRHVPRLVAVHAMQDRKSTRLNSSHSQISYAVFCLKKKK